MFKFIWNNFKFQSKYRYLVWKWFQYELGSNTFGIDYAIILRYKYVFKA